MACKIGYMETQRKMPLICPRGMTTEQMYKKFGSYINVYDNKKKHA